MEKEENTKVILDYDKYQRLLAKANLNEKTIQEIKDAAYKEGLRFGSDEVSKLETRYRDLETKYFNLNNYIDELTKESYNRGFAEGCRSVHSDVRYQKSCAISNLNSCFKSFPALSFCGINIYANETFCKHIMSYVVEGFDCCLEEKKSIYGDRVNQLSGQNCSQAASM